MLFQFQYKHPPPSPLRRAKGFMIGRLKLHHSQKFMKTNRQPYFDIWWAGGIWQTIVGLLLGLLFAGPSLLMAASQNPVSAEEFMARGTQEFHQGNYEGAADQWWRAARLYEASNDTELQVKAILRYSEALQYSGRYTDIIFALTVLINQSQQVKDPTLLAITHERLGNAYLALDEINQAQQHYTEGLRLASQIHNVALQAALTNDLGNVSSIQAAQDYRQSRVWANLDLEEEAAETRALGQKKNDRAIEHYSNAVSNAQKAGNKPLEVTALLNMSKASILRGHFEKARDQVTEASKLVQQIPDSSQKAHSLIDIGITYQDLRHYLSPSRTDLFTLAERSMKQAATIGMNIGDPRAKAYAWGQLGNLYEEDGHIEEALGLTESAVFAAQLVKVPELLYRWEWQLGRLFRAQGNIQQAETAYQRAVDSLTSIPRNLPAGYRQRDVGFREGPGRLYFEFSDLYFQKAAAGEKPKNLNAQLTQARSIMDEFKVAEIQDYYQDDCVDAYGENIKTVDQVIQDSPDTVTVYPITFPDRLEILVGSSGDLHRYQTKITEKEMKKLVDEFRWSLEKEESFQFLGPAKKLYNVLIKPLVSDLDPQKTKTLVFIPDGSLRTIPMAALYDEETQSFLIQKYAVATTSGFKLPDPKPIDRKRLKILSVGLTSGGAEFAPLPGVQVEQEELQRIYGKKKITRLFDEDFKVADVEKEMKKEAFTIVHVATHGIFEHNVTESFLLASENKKLTMDHLDQMMGLFKFRETPLDLLTLSACETASGDDRAALGLAGVALKAGARSALATLWSINDEASSTLVSSFYEELNNNPTISKAQALRQAQIRMITKSKPHYRHPFYWAAFLLIDNWL